MEENESSQLEFSSLYGRKVQADFGGGTVTSDAGLLLIREVDRRLGLVRSIATGLSDQRQSGKVVHQTETMIRQRVMGLVAGWEDLNDATTLRHDPVHQVAAGTTGELASAPTLCRFENTQGRQTAWAVNTALVETFIRSHRKAPAALVLDFDATDTPVHGRQEGRFFHGYYDTYCFLPLYVFCGDQLLVAYLRPSNIDASRHAGAILQLLYRRFRQEWPRVKIVLRADSGFCRQNTLNWCDRTGVKYVVGLAKNERLLRETAALMEQARQTYEKTGDKQRLFTAFDYAADTWTRVRWVIAKAEHSALGSNPRFIVTNIVGDSRKIYDHRYCARGEMENRVKEQMMLFADRVSAHQWWANQWRILLSAIAYTLLEALRRLGLKGTDLAQATCATIRTKLIKIGAVIVRKASVLRVHLASHHPLKALFCHAALSLVPP